MISTIDFLVERSILSSFSYVLTIVFDRISLKLDEQREFGYDCGNNENMTIITNNLCKIHATAIVVVGFLTHVFYHILQAINTSSLNIALQIQFEAVVVVVNQLMSTFVASSMDVVSLLTQAIRNVCSVFSEPF